MSGILASLEFEQIPVYKPGEVEYEKSVATAYLLYRFARPSYVVQPTHPAQVQDIVRYLVEYNDRQNPDSQVSITIKNGGHSYAGFSSTDKGILLDLSKMNRVKLNLDKDSHPKSVTIRGGALWGHVYKQLINGRHKGYMLAGGDCPTVGVSGFVLGGGLSAFSRSLGMACDNLTEATIITADGRMVTVGENSDPDSNEGKLFWALRGGGAGNFGIIVQLKMNIHQLQKEDDGARTRETVIAGRYTWFPYPREVEEAKFMATMNEFYTTKWADSLAIHSTWICDLQDARTLPAVRFIVYHNGEKNSFDKQLDKFVEQRTPSDQTRERRRELAEPLRRRSLAEPTTLFLHETLLAQWSEETQMFFPSDKSYKYFSSFVFENDESTIKEVTSMIKDRMRAFRDQFSRQQGLLQVTLIHSGGKAGSPTANATAFPWRKDICYIAYIMVRWREKWLGEEMKSFCVSFTGELREKSMKGKAAFINFADKTLRRNQYEEAYYDVNVIKLQEVKAHWDPKNLFHFSQSIRLVSPDAGYAAGDSYRPATDEQLVHDQWESYTSTLPQTNDFPGIEGYPYSGF